MTVSELIKKLQTYNGDLPVITDRLTGNILADVEIVQLTSVSIDRVFGWKSRYKWSAEHMNGKPVEAVYIGEFWGSGG